MTDPDYGLAVPIIVRYHQKAFDQILESIKEGTYCAVLGPRLCGKTVLLRFVERTLNEVGWTCLYLDLRSMRAATLQGFFTELMHQTAAGIRQILGGAHPISLPAQASSPVFRGYLLEALQVVGRDLVLIIDNLDATPTDLVQALLTSLRAAYMDQQGLNTRLTVVVSGALSMATLAVGESSPFRGIARSVFVGDLSEDQSRDLITDYLDAEGIGFTQPAQERLLTATRGDAYLIRKLCQRCVEAVRPASESRLGAGKVTQVTRAFMRTDVRQYAPLREAVRLIEEDPDLMRCILMLLERDTVKKAELPLPLSPDLDPLYLTGVVEQVKPDRYRLQNLIYLNFLAEHFRPGKVGQLLALAGYWNESLDYLEQGVINGDTWSRSAFLPAAIQSIYAASDLEQAASYLSRGLLSGFGAQEVQVWYARPGERNLRLIGLAGDGVDPRLWANPELPMQADRLETRAYRQASTLRGSEIRQTIQRAIPLKIAGRDPVGVVIISDALPIEHVDDPRDREWQLIGFLNQAARAIDTVGTRRQELALAGRMQASLMPERAPTLEGWDFTAVWRPARETSGDFFDFIPFEDGRIGIVLADVTDKGLGAALYMTLSRTLLRTFAGAYPDQPRVVLHKVNERILEDTHGGLFISLFYGLFDPIKGRLSFCNAGHHPPFHIRAKKGQKIERLDRTGMPLGVSEEATWGVKNIQLNPGNLLLMYTDGVVEAHNTAQELFGTDRMLEIAHRLKHRSAQDVQDAIVSEVRAFTGSEGQFDDLTLVLLKRHNQRRL